MMATKTGLRLGSVAAEVNGSNGFWTGETNILSITTDGSNAKFSFGSDAESSPTGKLKVSGFGFKLPRGAKILGVDGRFRLNSNYFSAGQPMVTPKIMIAGSPAGTAKSFTALGSSIWETNDVGGPSDLWGISEISVEQVNDPLFGLYIDHVGDASMDDGWFKLAFAQMSIWYAESNASSLALGQSPLP